MTDGCAAPPGGVSVEGVDLSKQSIIEGVVTRGGDAPVAGAYVRLLDASGEFTAEVPTDDAGQFRFFAGPGRWTVRTLAPRSTPVDRVVIAQHGVIAEVAVSLPA
ncbi:MAG: DUF1416 domain-containing protein [Jiangellaceae bacterium]